MPHSNAISEAEVHEAANALNTGGVRPTLDGIRVKLGHRGSYSTIRRYLGTWHPPDPVAEEAGPIPAELEARIAELVRQIWVSAVSRAAQICETPLASARAERDSLERDFERLSETADEIATERDRLRAAEEDRKLELDALRGACETLRGKYQAAHAEAAELRRRLKAGGRAKAKRAPASDKPPDGGSDDHNTNG